jgi:PAP2 superfamily
MVSQAPRRPARSRLWVEALIVAWLCWVYDLINNLAPLRQRLALGHARSLWHLERALQLDPELALNRWLALHHTLGLILSYYYDNAHFVVTFGVLAWLWWRRPDIHRSLRNSLALVNVLAFAVFWLYPVAPPRMLSSVGFTDVVASTHAFGNYHTGSLASSANQFAAMPSLHIAWAVWCAVVLWSLSRRPWVRALALLYPCLTTLVVLATGNHFFLDVVGGLAAMAAAGALERTGPAWRMATSRAAPAWRPLVGRVAFASRLALAHVAPLRRSAVSGARLGAGPGRQAIELARRYLGAPARRGEAQELSGP